MYQAAIWWKNLQITWKPMSKIFYLFYKNTVLRSPPWFRNKLLVDDKITRHFLFLTCFLLLILWSLNSSRRTLYIGEGERGVYSPALLPRGYFSDAYAECRKGKGSESPGILVLTENEKNAMNTGSNTNWLKTWFHTSNTKIADK